MMVSRGNLVGTVRSNGLHDDSFFRKNKQARKMSGRHKRRIKSELRIESSNILNLQRYNI